MIKNKKQAALVRKEIADLIDLIADMDIIAAKQKFEPKQQLQYDIFKSRVEELKSEISEYEFLTSKNLHVLEITSGDLQKAIISFRIASGLTQSEIAKKIDIQEQQIQRYEQNDYLTASFERIIQILRTLEVEVTLKKKFSNETKIVDFNKFIIPEKTKNIIESSMIRVCNRKQLVNW